jgi:hypothetical protein
VTATALDDLVVPDFAEPFEAWRVWRVVAGKDGYRLGSVVKPTVWPPGEPLVADCLRSSPLAAWFRRKRSAGRPVPDERCECGIYAGVLRWVGEYLRDLPASVAVARVLGRVSLWGRVIECERGFRASHAYPLHLYVPVDSSFHSNHRWEALAAGLEVYGVSVDLLPTRCAEAVRVLEQNELAAARRESA